jgi:hypothetical protein
MSKVVDSATNAVYVMQLSSKSAVRHVMEDTGCDRATAEDAVKQVVKAPIRG